MKSYLSIYLILILVINIAFTNAQNSSPDYFIDEFGDTTFCTAIELRSSGSDVTKIRYSTPDGRVHLIQGKSNCEAVKTLSINNQIYDLIPVDPLKPGGEKQHVWRKIDGPIKLYDYYREVKGSEKGVYIEETKSYEISIYTVKLEDDIYAEVNDKTMALIIEPFLLNCPQFVAINKNEITADKETFELIVKLYNALCP